jgi:hypothetical protein
MPSCAPKRPSHPIEPPGLAFPASEGVNVSSDASKCLSGCADNWTLDGSVLHEGGAWFEYRDRFAQVRRLLQGHVNHDECSCSDLQVLKEHRPRCFARHCNFHQLPPSNSTLSITIARKYIHNGFLGYVFAVQHPITPGLTADRPERRELPAGL